MSHKILTTVLAATTLALATACQSSPSRRPAAASAPLPMDVHSFAEPNRVRVHHVRLDLTVDPVSKITSGLAELELTRIDPTAPLVLDTLDLAIEQVHGSDGTRREFELGEADPNLGSALTIQLAPKDDSVVVTYATTPGCDAMQWLAPEQTADGTHPFLFTQGQSILTRSWIPLQDSPGVRVTYAAEIRAPEGLTAVMSAEQLGLKYGAWSFRMENAIPPYLIALGVGKLEFRALSDRTGVWAEPSFVDAAAAELEDTESMVQSAESLFGPYRWGRYDMLVLPPAFPFGGMENPMLTFLTPTMFAGDKSLVGLIAHELAHSWSGNLVTNATWRDFWLNEGTTTYIEQRIMEEVYGVNRTEMEQLLGYDGLVREMAGMDARDTVLHINLEGRHPDEGFSGVPYEKGALFLKRLELVYGRERFDEFLTTYFDEHAFQSITTGEFEAYLRANLLATDPTRAARIDIDEWLYQPGLPADAPQPTSSELARVDTALGRLWLAVGPEDLDTEGWVTQQWLHFLEGLPADLSVAQMAELDNAFGFTASGNNEILAVWLRLSIANGYSAADERLEEFLMTVGRRKFLQPLYTELAKTTPGKQRGREIYANARPRYHSVSSGTIDEILGWKSAK